MLTRSNRNGIQRKSPLPTPRSGMKSLFDFSPFIEATGQNGPPVDVWEGDHAYTIRVEIPGTDADDISIQAEGDRLTITGERGVSIPEDAQIQRKESAWTEFKRTFTLPDDVDLSEHPPEAEMANGVLEIKIPKVEQEQTIDVEVRPRDG